VRQIRKDIEQHFVWQLLNCLQDKTFQSYLSSATGNKFLLMGKRRNVKARGAHVKRVAAGRRVIFAVSPILCKQSVFQPNNRSLL
jgi:hypothetical protein